jgi:hypothetical protein
VNEQTVGPAIERALRGAGILNKIEEPPTLREMPKTVTPKENKVKTKM